MHLTTEQLAALRRQYGPGLHLPPGLDVAQMLWASPAAKVPSESDVFRCTSPPTVMEANITPPMKPCEIYRGALA